VHARYSSYREDLIARSRAVLDQYACDLRISHSSEPRPPEHLEGDDWLSWLTSLDVLVSLPPEAGPGTDWCELAPAVMNGAVVITTAESDFAPLEPGEDVAVATSAGFADSLRRLLADDERRQRMRSSALGRLEVRFFPDRTAILDGLRRGLIDVAPSPTVEADLARTLDKFGDANGVIVYKTPAEALEILHFSSRGPFAERAVRKAVELAVDRQSIVDDVFAGLARVPRSYLVPPLWAAAESGPIVRPDREAARALLAQAGYRHGTFGILERDIDRLSVTLLVVAGSEGRVDAARRVAGDLAALGIAVDVRTRPASEVEGAVAAGTFDLALMPERADDASLASERWLGRAGPWFDVLAGAAERADGRDEKQVLYAELQRIWSDALPGLPLYQRLRVDIAANALTGVQPPPQDQALTWNVAAWRFETR